MLRAAVALRAISNGSPRSRRGIGSPPARGAWACSRDFARLPRSCPRRCGRDQIGRPAEQSHQTPCAVVGPPCIAERTKPLSSRDCRCQAGDAGPFFIPSILLSGLYVLLRGCRAGRRRLARCCPDALCSRRRAALLKGQDGSIVHEIWPIGFFGLVAAAVALAAYRRRLEGLLS